MSEPEVITVDTQSLIYESLTPKRYQNVSGGQFSHPNQWAKSLAKSLSSAYTLTLLGRIPSLGQINVITTANALRLLGMPYYYVAPDYLRSVIDTSLPEDMEFGELEWPCTAVTFGLPLDVVREYVGFNVEIPFLAGALFPHSGELHPFLPETAGAEIEALEDIVANLPDIGVKVEKPRMTSIFTDVRDERIRPDISAFYGGSYHLTMKVKEIQTMEHHIWASTPWSGEAALNLTRDKEAEVQRRMGLLFVKLLVHMFIEGPRYIEPGTRARHGSAKHAKHQRAELWNVPFIGRAYVIPRGEGGTHESPGKHLRRAHVVRQAHGPREAMIHVIDLPRTSEGETDWDKVTAEMKAKFWACHKLIKVKDIIVRPDAGEDLDRQPASGDAAVQTDQR